MLNLEPNLYYESIPMTIIVDDVGSGGSPGLPSPKQRDDGTTVADMQVMVDDFKVHGLNAVLGIDAAIMTSEHESWIDESNQFAGNQTANQAPGIGKYLGSKKITDGRRMFKLHNGFHSHNIGHFKAAGPLLTPSTQLSDTTMVYLWQEYMDPMDRDWETIM